MHSFSNLETNFVKAPYLEALQQLRSLNTQNLRPTLLQYTTQGSSLVQYNIFDHSKALYCTMQSNLCWVSTSFQAKEGNKSSFVAKPTYWPLTSNYKCIDLINPRLVIHSASTRRAI
jgi:hypothetical protein